MNVRKRYTDKWMIPALVGIIFFMSCKNDIEVVQRITSIETFPTLEASDVTILRSDSGNIVMRIETPMISQYAQATEPYTSFPKGLKAIFFDRNGEVSSEISANEVMYYENDEKWVARYDVVVIDRNEPLLILNIWFLTKKKDESTVINLQNSLRAMLLFMVAVLSLILT